MLNVMKKIKSFIWYQLPPLIFMGLIFSLSSIPNLKIDDSDAEFFRRKLAHLIEYGLLAVLFYRSFLQEKWTEIKKEHLYQIILAVLLSTFYGATDEIHQSFVPTRDGLVKDLIFDFVGSVMGMGSIAVFSKLQKSHPEIKIPKNGN